MLDFITKVEEFIWTAPLVFLLVFTHVYFTIKLKYPQKYTLKGLKLMFKPSNSSKKNISSFKSLMTILAGTLGTGNIIGVGTAILIGGIGSIFWIFISGIFAIATKYAETFLVLKYRKKEKGKFYGGTMYVLRDIMKNKFLSICFSIFVVIASFGIGAMIQSNAIKESVVETFYINKYLVAFITTILCSYIVLGDEKRIANISSILVPVASIMYLFMCIYLTIVFRKNIIPSIILIVKEGMSFRATTGGLSGVLMIRAMNAGLSKGLFSNEAGMGSSPLFNATVDGKDVKKESIIASTSVFIDTVILCTLTGIIFVASGMWKITENAISFSKITFSFVPYGDYLLAFCLSLFAISTIPCWSYYGKMGINFLFKNSKRAEKIYKYIYIISIFLGTILTLKVVWSISSIANALMILPNLYMLYKLKDKIEI